MLDHEIVAEVHAGPEPEIYQGHRGFGDLEHMVYEAFGQFCAEPEDFIEIGDRVLVPLLLRVRGAQSGVSVVQKAFHIWEIREAKVIRLQLFLDRERALEAVGLRDLPSHR